MAFGNSLLVGAAIHLSSCSAFGQQVPLHAQPGSPLQKIISDAQKHNSTSVSSPRMGFTERVPAGLDDVLNESVVVVAKYEGQTSAVSDEGIVTSYRFSVSRQFNTRKKSAQDEFEKRPLALPAGVAAPARSELLLSHLGGTAVVDGVTVTTPNSFPAFAPGQTYCLFLQPSPGVEGYSLYYGSSAVYRVDRGVLVPANSGPDNLIKADLRARFNARLSLLQAHLAAISKGAGRSMPRGQCTHISNSERF